MFDNVAWDHVGIILGPGFWLILDTFGTRLSIIFGTFFDAFGLLLGAFWSPFWSLFGAFGLLLGPKITLGRLRALFDPILVLRRCSWGALGVLLGSLGVLLGSSWDALGALEAPKSRPKGPKNDPRAPKSDPTEGKSPPGGRKRASRSESWRLGLFGIDFGTKKGCFFEVKSLKIHCFL